MSLASDRGRALQPIKRNVALYVGGMGSKDENFHKRMIERSGYGEAAQRSRTCGSPAASPRQWRPCRTNSPRRSHGRQPDELRARLAAWRASPVTTLMISRSATFEETVRNMEFLAAEVPADAR